MSDETILKSGGRGRYVYPPATFHLIPNAFRPTDTATIDEGLLNRVQKLISATRMQSAMDEIFAALERNPQDETALRLAMMVFQSRSDSLRAVEPLTISYLNDTRLDPIYTVCSNCKKSAWVSHNCLMPAYATMTVTSPIGLQCYTCGFVVCRECMEKTGAGVDLVIIEKTCPNCKQGILTVPVFPTGRLPQQLARRPAPVMDVVVMREGPLPPTGEYLSELFKAICPDVMEGDPRIHGYPSADWSSDVYGLMGAILARMEVEGELEGEFESADISEWEDHLGNRVCIARAWAPASLAAQSADSMRRHVARMEAQERGSPAFSATQPLWQRLLGSGLRHFAQASVARAAKTFQKKEGPFLNWKIFGDLALSVSVLPGADPRQARQAFNGDYMSFMDRLAQRMGAVMGKHHLAHWIFLLNGDQIASTHLTMLPNDPQNMLASFALDMLTPQEKTSLGFPADEPHLASEQGRLFWFDWQAISDAGHPMYGRYVYQRALPWLAPGKGGGPKMAVLYDGDCLPEGESIEIPVANQAERAVVSALAQRSLDDFYVLAVYADQESLRALTTGLESARPLGYVGATSCPGMDVRAFDRFTGEMALVFAGMIQGRRFKKAGFGFLSDEELRALGFEPQEFER